MKLIIFLYFIPFIWSNWWEDSKVPSLTKDTWNEVVGNKKHAIVDFFTPW